MWLRGNDKERIMKGVMKTRALLTLLILLQVGPALATGDQVDTSSGEALARSWCTECHAVTRGNLQSPRPGVPSFTAIARQPSTTTMSIQAFLTTSHPRMPNVKLTPEQLDDIARYILSLRDTR